MKANVQPRFTNKEWKALQKEISNQISENVHNMSLDLMALVLWYEHEKYGKGKKRLLDFAKDFAPKIKELEDYYQSRDANDTQFICRYKLKHEVGIDVADLDEMFRFDIRINE